MLCPKCHRPIEGDEVYICCSETELRWRCEACGKVSEGFAFPYGMCPLCGGELKPLEGAREIENDEDLEAIRIAFEIEISGRAFYLQTAREAKEPALKDLFGRLAEMERGHMELLAKRYRVKAPEPDESSHGDWASIYAGVDHDPENPAHLFEIAIKFEQRAVDYFTERSDKAAEGSMERQLYKELAAEEREHADLLRTERDRWKAGKEGLL